MGKRKRYTAEQKVSILREVVEEGKAVSEAAAKYDVHPTMILNWRKQLFEGALQTFETQRPDISEKANERKSKCLEVKLAEKDNVIAELAQEVLQLKKKHSGLK
jgi:transposase-like protein